MTHPPGFGTRTPTALCLRSIRDHDEPVVDFSPAEEPVRMLDSLALIISMLVLFGPAAH